MVSDFVTISKVRNNYLEFQYEENKDFEKYIKSKIPFKFLVYGITEKDIRYNRVIKYLKIHKRYWKIINKNMLRFFVNCWGIKNGKTYNLKTMEKITERNKIINFI